MERKFKCTKDYLDYKDTVLFNRDCEYTTQVPEEDYVELNGSEGLEGLNLDRHFWQHFEEITHEDTDVTKGAISEWLYGKEGVDTLAKMKRFEKWYLSIPDVDETLTMLKHKATPLMYNNSTVNKLWEMYKSGEVGNG